jgi:hypothetical protein
MGSRTENVLIDAPLSNALRIKPSLRSCLMPIIDYKPMMGLDSYLLKKHHLDHGPEAFYKIPMLHLDYGHCLRTNLMASDPFYALSEVFALTASSEKQFLDLVEFKLEQANAAPGKTGHDDLENLRYLNTLLYQHVRRIQCTISFISNANHAKWPKADDDVTRRSRKQVEQDHQHLYEHATTLYQRCQSEIAVLMNSIVILESEKAMNLSERIGKLTFLASIFAPLSFTTSFFGMNVKGLQSVSVWIWVVSTFFILAIALGVMFVNVRKHYNWVRRKMGKVG